MNSEESKAKSKLMVTPSDRMALVVYRFTSKYGPVLLALASGVLIERICNELSAGDVKWNNLLPRIFSIRERPTNLVSIIAVILMVLVPVALYISRKMYTGRRYDIVFAKLLEKLQDSAFCRYNTICLQQALTLQNCPLLDAGWRMSDIKINHHKTMFSMPKDIQLEYASYFKAHAKEERFIHDENKVMLIKNPTAFSDAMSLTLETRETKYSVAKFYWNRVASNSHKRDEYVETAINQGIIAFAHILCLHLVVVTSDNKVLLTKRSAKVGFYPGKWSCSIEEQMQPQDMSPGNRDAVLRWGRRALKEELGLDNDDELITYRDEELKILSVFIEGEGMGVSLCGYVKLDIDKVTLDALIRNYPRGDYEFTEWTFVNFSELLDETFIPEKFHYHPTSRYRMLMALLHNYGETRVARAYLRHSPGL